MIKKIVATKSFNLALNIEGDEKSDRLVLLLPGRLDTKDYINFDSHLDYLAKRGFLAVSFDPPGTWESPGDISLYTTTNYIKAVNELIEYFGNRPTLLFGHSRGGAVAILSAQNPHVIGVIAAMPNLGAPIPPDPESIKSGIKISHRDMPPGAERTKGQKEFSLPIAYFEDGEKYNPSVAIRDLKKPKMIIYGSKDELLDPKTTLENAKKAPEPKIVKELDSPHSYRRIPEMIIQINELIGQFVDKFIDQRS